MAVSKAQQRATNKYISKAYDRVNLTLPKGRKAEFSAHADARGESLNAFIGRAMMETMERDTSQQPVGAPVRAANPLEGIITPDTLKAAQRAAKENGEGIPSFMARAVDMEVRRDKAAWGLGFNPATGKEEKKGDKPHE